MFLDMVEEFITPSPSQIGRWRLLLDAAFMITTRAERRRDWQAQQRCVRWIMIDSSPQGGRDYELIVMCKAYVGELRHLMGLLDIMYNMCMERPTADTEDEEDEFFMSEQQRLQSEIQQLLVIERPPPVVLGSGRTSLPDKFAATMHALFLETGSAKDLLALTSEIVTCTSDLGTVFNIVRVQGARARDLLPWMPQEVVENEGDWPSQEEPVNFPNALAFQASCMVCTTLPSGCSQGFLS